MQTVEVKLDRKQARELYRTYKKHSHYSEPIDWEVQRAYQMIAQGRMVIRAIESIKQAGVDEKGLPKLAIARATQKTCVLRTSRDGSFTMGDGRSQWRNRNLISFPAGSLSFPETPVYRGKEIVWYRTPSGEAVLPLIPIHLRPKRGLESYHVLWEAEWTPLPPTDPFLLRRIGKADLWVVVAAWDLTAVEKAALSTRIAG
ncbi:MAG: hypothetical protein GEU95_00990 [Rhizobiales bacterium]|nr:hypothetical protein [Hyphomicrobiales bacterium]